MTTEFRNYADSIADKIFGLSLQLDNEIETWRDVVARVPDSTSKGVSDGFITKPDSASGIEIVADIQAPPTEQTARLRIRAMEIIKDGDDNERFNGIQLIYSLDYDKAHKLVEQTDALTRNDLSVLAKDSANQLENIVISDLTGRDSASDQLLGKRYDLSTDELNAMNEKTSIELKTAMDSVLERLQKSAAKK